MTLGLNALDIDGVIESDTGVILEAIHDFYNHLYRNSNTKSDEEILNFLNKIPSLPRILQDTTSMVQPFSVSEVESAIKALCPGKSPGSDGLTSEFYKHFEQELSGILCDVFNALLDHGSLSDSQKLAIIILLFKKGSTFQLGNYRPISLTNADYKILAYILTMRLTPMLLDIISSSQTAYMKNCFIGTNIHCIQDMIDHMALHNRSGLVLFLDFSKGL